MTTLSRTELEQFFDLVAVCESSTDTRVYIQAVCLRNRIKERLKHEAQFKAWAATVDTTGMVPADPWSA